jgi:hypothetical protein
MKQKTTHAKSRSTMFARGVIYLVGLAALAVCVIMIPELIREESVEKPINPYLIFSFLAGAYLLATPFFVALYQTLKFLNYIDKNKAFSNRSIKALQIIKICAIVFSAMIIIAVVTGITLIRSIDPTEDVTPFITLGFLFTFVSTVIAVFVALLQKLLAEAVAIKSENDLII